MDDILTSLGRRAPRLFLVAIHASTLSRCNWYLRYLVSTTLVESKTYSHVLSARNDRLVPAFASPGIAMEGCASRPRDTLLEACINLSLPKFPIVDFTDQNAASGRKQEGPNG